MPRLPVVRGNDAIQAFRRAGFYLDHWRGSHSILYHPDGRHLSIPGGHRELKPGLLRTLIRDAALTVKDFTALLTS